MCPPCPTPTFLSMSSQLAGPKMPPSHLSDATTLTKPETWELFPASPSFTHIQLGSLCPAKSPPHPLSDLSAQPHLPCSRPRPLPPDDCSGLLTGLATCSFIPTRLSSSTLLPGAWLYSTSLTQAPSACTTRHQPTTHRGS